MNKVHLESCDAGWHLTKGSFWTVFCWRSTQTQLELSPSLNHISSFFCLITLLNPTLVHLPATALCQRAGSLTASILSPPPVWKRVEVSDPGTLWPQQRLQSARRMRSILRPEEAGGGRGSYTHCHPANPRLSNLTFSRNGVGRRLRAGFCAAGGRECVISEGPRSGPELRGRRIWVRQPCLPCLRRTTVSACSPSSRLWNIPLSLPRMSPHSRPLSSAVPPPVFNSTFESNKGTKFSC